MTHDEPVITSAAAQPAQPSAEGGRSTLCPSLGDMPQPSPSLRRLLADREPEPVGPGFQSSI